MTCGKPDIRKATVLVIRKGNQYLSRIEMLTGRVVWSPELSSAWRTRNREKARNAAETYGGEPILFNPIIWRVKAL